MTHRTGNKPLYEPMMTYFHLAPEEQTSVNFLTKIQVFEFNAMNLKCRLQQYVVMHSSVDPCVTFLRNIPLKRRSPVLPGQLLRHSKHLFVPEIHGTMRFGKHLCSNKAIRSILYFFCKINRNDTTDRHLCTMVYLLWSYIISGTGKAPYSAPDP